MNYPIIPRFADNYVHAFLPRRSVGLLVALSVIMLGSLWAVRADAQSHVTPNVIIDESVLDELGPPPNLPGMMRERPPKYLTPRRYPSRNSGYSTGTPSRLLPAPRRMPRSHVNAPQPSAQPRQVTRPSRTQVSRPVAAPPPPPRMSGKGPGVLGKVKQSGVDNLGAPPAARKSARRASAPPPQRAAAPPPPPSTIVPALPKTVVPVAPKVAVPSPPSIPAPPPSAAASRVVPPPSTPLPPSAPPPAPKVNVPPPPSNVAVQAPPAPAKVIAPPAPKVTAPPAAQIVPPPAQKAAPPRVASLPPNVPPAVASKNGGLVSVNFAKGATELPPGIAPFLSDFVKKMKADKSMRLQLKGYAGGVKGSASQARRVSLFRALSVRTYLMKQGVRSTRMDVRALGKKVGKGMPNRVDIEVKK